MSAVGSSADSSSSCAQIRFAISSSTCWPSTTMRWCSSRSNTVSVSVMDAGAERRMVTGGVRRMVTGAPRCICATDRSAERGPVSCRLTSPCRLLVLGWSCSISGPYADGLAGRAHRRQRRIAVHAGVDRRCLRQIWARRCDRAPGPRPIRTRGTSRTPSWSLSCWRPLLPSRRRNNCRRTPPPGAPWNCSDVRATERSETVHPRRTRPIGFTSAGLLAVRLRFWIVL